MKPGATAPFLASTCAWRRWRHKSHQHAVTHHICPENTPYSLQLPNMIEARNRNPRRMRFCCAHGVDTGRLWAPAGDARSEQGSTDCAEPSTPASGQCKAAEHLLIGGDCHPLEHVANTRLARPHCCVQSCLRGQGVRGDCGRRSSPARVARERTCGRPSESAEDPRDASSPLSARSPGPATAPLCHVRRSSAKILPLCASAWPQLRALGG